MPVDLSAVPKLPTMAVISVGTTWTEVKLPARAASVTLKGDGGFFVAGEENGYPGSTEQPTDGGPVGTHKLSVAVGDAPLFEVRPHQRGYCSSLFVAGDGASVNITVEME